MMRFDSIRSAPLAARAATKLRRSASPTVAGLLRVELDAPNTAAALHHARERLAVRRRRRRSAVADRRRERVREVGLRAAGMPASRRDGRSRLERVPADVRHLESQRRRAGRPDATRSRRSQQPTPARQQPEARQLRRLARCPRTATACPGRCRAAAAGADSRADRARATSHRARPSRRSARRPARRSPSARASSAGPSGVARRRRRQPRRALRTDVRLPGAVVDERDHCYSSPLVLGSIRAQLAVLRAGDAQRAAERLERGLDPVVARAAVEHLQVHVAARAEREALEEVVHELGLEVAHAAARARRATPRRAAGPPRSMAATASVSSIGITK